MKRLAFAILCWLTGTVLAVPTQTNNNNFVFNGTGTFSGAVTFSLAPTMSGANITNLNATNLASGTVPDARFPGSLPAISGANLTGLNGSNIASGTVPVARGGTNLASYTTGDIPYASGATTIAKLAAVATGQVLTSAGTGTAPAYSATPAVTSVTCGNLSLLTNAINNTAATLNITGPNSSIVQLTSTGAYLHSASNGIYVAGNRCQIGPSSAYSIGDSSINGTQDIYFGRRGNAIAVIKTDRAVSTAPTLNLEGKSDTNSDRKVATLATAWVTATDASRKGRLIFNASDASADRECIRIESDGSLGYVGIAGAIDTSAKLTVNGNLKVTGTITETATTFSAYGAGTAYSVTNSSAAVDFGTTDPSITLTTAGTYMIQSRVVWNNNNGGDAVLMNLKLRRTNNTAADVSNSATSIEDNIESLSGLPDQDHVVSLPPVIYTTSNTNDVVTIFAQDGGAAAGDGQTIKEASIVAIRIGG